MKIQLRFVFPLVFVASLLLFGAAQSAAGQVRTGGYKTVSVENADVQAAAEFAVRAKGEELQQEIQLEGVSKAETQVVQGMNFRLCIRVYAPSTEAETDGVEAVVQVVVYRNLKGEFSLTAWEDIDCAEK